MGRERRELRAKRDCDEKRLGRDRVCLDPDPSRPYHNYAFASPLSSTLVGPSRKKQTTSSLGVCGWGQLTSSSYSSHPEVTPLTTTP